MTGLTIDGYPVSAGMILENLKPWSQDSRYFKILVCHPRHNGAYLSCVRSDVPDVFPEFAASGARNGDTGLRVFDMSQFRLVRLPTRVCQTGVSMQTVTINKKNAERLIRASGGSIFSVRFTKRDGTFRDMTCRLGVKSHAKGGKQAYNPKEHGLITVFDMTERGYRMVSLDTVYQLTIDGNTFSVK